MAEWPTYPGSDVRVRVGDAVLWGDTASATVVFVVGTEDWRADFALSRDWWAAECGEGVMVEFADGQHLFVPLDDFCIQPLPRSDGGPAAG